MPEPFDPEWDRMLEKAKRDSSFFLKAVNGKKKPEPEPEGEGESGEKKGEKPAEPPKQVTLTLDEIAFEHITPPPKTAEEFIAVKDALRYLSRQMGVYGSGGLVPVNDVGRLVNAYINYDPNNVSDASGNFLDSCAGEGASPRQAVSDPVYTNYALAKKVLSEEYCIQPVGELQILMAFRTFCAHEEDGKYRAMHESDEELDPEFVRRAVADFMAKVAEVCGQSGMVMPNTTEYALDKDYMWELSTAITSQYAGSAEPGECPEPEKKKPLWKRILGI